MLGVGCSLNRLAASLVQQDRCERRRRQPVPTDMAAQTPRKRKQSATGHLSSFATPVKKLMMDCSVVVSPLQSRNPNSSDAMKRSPAPNYTAVGDPMDKENMAATPSKSSVARKLLVSPPLMEYGDKDAYDFSPVKSPDSSKGALSAKSFYRKATVYVTPIERKLISESKRRSGQNTSPLITKSDGKESSKFTRIKRLPTAKKRKSTGSSATVKKARGAMPKTVRSAAPKNKSTPPPESENKAPSNPERSETPPEEPNVHRTAILGLKMKPRPKLTVGAAFFATGRRPHSAPKRLPALLKLPASTKPSFKPVKKSMAPTVKPANAAPQVLKEEAVISQKAVTGCALSTRKKSESERHRDADAKRKSPEQAEMENGASPPEGRRLVRRLHEQGADSESRMTFDDDETLKNSGKKQATVYPIFSTPAGPKKRSVDFRVDLMSPVSSGSPLNTPLALNKVQKPNKRKDSNKVADDQLIIDAGQKHFGPVSCSTCGMIYSASNVEDEAQHAQYHQRLLESIHFVGWKKERVVAEFWDGKILMICPEDAKYALRKAEEVRELVDAELGFQQGVLSSSRIRTYLYVTNDKKIVGCLIAEPIKQAFRVLAEPSSPEIVSTSALERHRAWRCSSEPQPAICGISRIWVFSLMRRKNLASRLVDAMRSSFIYGSRLTTDEIAFSDPTPDGKLFASNYCRVPDFLVYNFLS
ncbi:N-acetyltransferase ESCO2 isoform X1 [Eleutherodactylus coqui]|uniref:N-acetyltransferase ESCO2 isoform X1 n=1 Tax=Eleutherodactylus coqui TaxID=57060 RepID=UPI0034631E10